MQLRAAGHGWAHGGVRRCGEGDQRDGQGGGDGVQGRARRAGVRAVGDGGPWKRGADAQPEDGGTAYGTYDE